MIRSAVAELHLVRFAADREADHLMPQADPEDRHAPDQFADLRRLMLKWFGIARPVREKHAVRLEREHIFGRRPRRNHGQFASRQTQAAKSIVLDSEIVSDNAKARLGRIALKIRGRAHLYRF